MCCHFFHTLGVHYEWEMDCFILQGSVSTLFRWGGHIFSRVFVTFLPAYSNAQIIKIELVFPELWYHNFFRSAGKEWNWLLTYTVDSAAVGVASIDVWRTDWVSSTTMLRQITFTLGRSTLRTRWQQLLSHIRTYIHQRNWHRYITYCILFLLYLYFLFYTACCLILCLLYHICLRGK